MTIINKQAEEKLFNLVEAVKNKSTGLRLAYIPLATINNKDIRIDSLTNIILDLVGKEDTKIFICQDNELFILSPKINLQIFEKLLLHVSTFLGISSSNIDMKLFELSQDWAEILTLSEEKLTIYKENIKKQNLPEDNKSKVDLDIELEEELINSFKSNRISRQQPKILIVEDDMFSRKLVLRSLTKEYEVIGAKDAKEAVQLYALHGPDVMFLDIGLPDATGHVVLQKILKFDNDAYIVMLSGKGDKENVLKAMNEGAKGFVGKPFAKEKLLQYIAKCPTIK